VDGPKPRTIHRILVLILLAALVPGMIVQALLHLQRFNTEQAREIQTHMDVARAVAVAFRAGIEDVAQEAHAVGIAILRFAPEDHEAASHFLSAALRSYPPAAELAWLSPDGRVIATSDGSAMGEDRHFEEYIAGLGRERSWVLGPVQPDTKTGAATFTVSRVLDDEEGKRQGILTIEIDAERFADTRLKIHRTPDAGFILFDKSGIAAFRRPHFPFPDWQRRNFSREEYVSEALAGREAGGKLDLPMTGKSWFTARTPIPDLGWVAGAGREYDKVMGPLWRDLYLGVGLSVLCLLISGGLALHYGRMILKDLRGLHDSVTASGNSRRTVGQSKLQGIAELCSIASAFEDVTSRRMEVERALRESEERFRLFMDNSPTIAWVKDEKGRHVYLSKTCEKRFGVKLGDWRGKTDAELWPSEIAEVFLGNDLAVLAAEHAIEVIEETVNPDGTRCCWLSSKFCFRDTTGNRFVAGIGLDITESKRAEAALRESEERYRTLFETMAEGFALHEILVDTDGKPCDYRFLEINPAFERLTGLKRHDLIGKRALEVLPGTEAYWIECYGRVALTGEPLHMEQYASELERWYEVLAYRTAPGQFAVVFSNITERRRSEEALRQALAKADEGDRMLSTLMEHVPEGITICDSDGKLRMVSRSGQELLGSHAGKSINEVVAEWKVYQPDGVTPMAVGDLPLNRAIHNQEPVTDIELVQASSRGEKLHLLCNAAPIRDAEDRIVGGIVAWRDITDRKRMEEELRKSRDDLEIRIQERTAELQTTMKRLQESNQALQDFASIASHDLQEPLRKVISFGNMLKQKHADAIGEEGKDYLKRMLSATDRMQSLLNSLLEYSRVATKSEPYREVDLGVIVSEVLSDLEVRIEKTGGKVELGELPVIEADPTQMRQLFQNLIGNALKFYKEGEKPVVKVHCSAGNLEYCEITVEDNGIGFEEKYLERVFAPFQRLHGRSSRYEGTGMGLAICKKIVERHRGSITAKTIPGEGAKFIITLVNRKGERVDG
jgi:PAS domain S-box-containing protein